MTPHAAISSDTLEDIIPEEVKAESGQSSALEVVMTYSGDEGEKMEEGEAGERGDEEDVVDIGGGRE